MTRPLSRMATTTATTTTTTTRMKFRASPSNRRMGIDQAAAIELLPSASSQDCQSYEEAIRQPLLQVTLVAIQSIWPSSSSSSSSDQNSQQNLTNQDHLISFLCSLLRRSRTTPNTLKLALFYIHQARRPLRQHISIINTNHMKSANHHLLRDPILSGRKMFLAALMIASKYLNDRNYSNRAWAKIAGLPIEEVNANERVFITLIGYRTHVDLDGFDVWSFRLQKLMNEKRIGAEPSSTTQEEQRPNEQTSPNPTAEKLKPKTPTSTVSSLPSSHSSPQRKTCSSAASTSSRRLSSASAIQQTPSLKLGSVIPAAQSNSARKPSIDLHTPIRQQALPSDARHGFATAPSRINARSVIDESFPPTRRRGTSDLSTPLRQQALPAVLSQSIQSTAPAHLNSSTHPPVCEPITPARQNSEYSTPIRQQQTLSSQPLLSHPDKPTLTPTRSKQSIHAQSTSRSELTTPAREKMTPILSRSSVLAPSSARSDMSIRQTVYATPAISNIGTSHVNPLVATPPSVRAYRQPALGSSSSLRRSSENVGSVSASIVGPPKRSASMLDNITPADVAQAERDLLEKVAQEKLLLAQQQEARRPTTLPASTKSSDVHQQQKRIAQLTQERRLRDEEKKEHLRRLLAEKNKKSYQPPQPVLELGQERWNRSGSIVSGLDRSRDDHPPPSSYSRRTEPRHPNSFGHSYEGERDDHLGQEEESSDSEETSSSDDQLSEELGYQARTSGELSFVQSRLYGHSCLQEGLINASDYRQPPLSQTRQPSLSIKPDPRFLKGKGLEDVEKDDDQDQSRRKSLERIRPSHDQEEPRESRTPNIQSSVTRKPYPDPTTYHHRTPPSVQARSTMGSGTRGLTTPISSGSNGQTSSTYQPTYRRVTPPLVSARPLQSCSLQAQNNYHHHHHHALSTSTRGTSTYQPVERRTESLASRPPPALSNPMYTRQAPPRPDDESYYHHHYPRHPSSRPLHPDPTSHQHHHRHHQSRSISDPYHLTNPNPSSYLTQKSLARHPSTSSLSRHALQYPYHDHIHSHHLYPSSYALKC
ncbi:hypothetical protein MJO28_003657 [Puccinia striiformis f. sp. tritici]|uniref:Uncharacterized protein n=1 Tax=Puccinia striiformis f. sp. tritici TaxID=168172 RepID=A0ACC0EQ69_9BASI|nr:hypothetical protein Pst134EB_008804 [Puccinia striiformis f. sp. tritici]KAI7956562.1 hypothetical protein MJO28_003657 [Puccinia striiformis f. sp. tritici]